MAKIGLEFPVTAVITGYDSITNEPIYDNGFVIGKAIEWQRNRALF